MKKILAILLISTLYLNANQIEVGDKAPNFILKTIDTGRSHSLKQFQGRVIVLKLWASWCRNCRREMPSFYSLQKKYNERKFRVLAISINEHQKPAQIFLTQLNKKMNMKTPFMVFHDPKRSVLKRYGAGGIPSTYLIDKKGIVQFAKTGNLD